VPPPAAKFVIGIDLGTTNSALSYAKVETAADPFAPAGVELLPIPQLANPGEVREETLLPSFLYLPAAAEFPSGTLALPWDAERSFVAGSLAQKRGGENAGRLVSSAKSWLSHSGVDRTSPLVPFRAPEGVDKISPVDASRRYLEHLREAWDYKVPEDPFAAQHVLVTVPASFDAVARELTLAAAEQAGYRDVTLLEEPQAAFYAWIERHPDWRERVTVGDLILVVDIGGGTTDFTLIAVTEANGELQLERVAVGEHILLGGDNIDLALAGAVAERLAQKGTRLDSRQMQALWNKRCGTTAARPRKNCWSPATRPKSRRLRFWGKAPGWWEEPSKLRCSGKISSASSPPASCPKWPAPTCRRSSAAWGCRNWAFPTPPMPPSPVTWRAFCASRPPSSAAPCAADRAAWRALPTCCSTAACSMPPRCAKEFSTRSTAGSPPRA
jgi:hypothetical protein